MVELHLDPRVAARADASDVVQEALTEAAARLPEFARRGDFPFYPWLRQIAWERLIQLHRRHIGAAKRTVRRERVAELGDSDRSYAQLAQWLAAKETSLTRRQEREERRVELMNSLQLLPDHYREIIVLRHLEELQFDEIATILQIGVEAVRSRYRRAIERLHLLLKPRDVELT
jgi:RNA polymerase sigma-70 factor (ECF subfamily)